MAAIHHEEEHRDANDTLRCPNPQCGKVSPAGNAFCGHCGHLLQADLKQLVQLVVAEQLKDREIVEKETAIAIVSRVWDWAKLFGAILGIAVSILIATLALVGYTQVADVHKAAAEAKKHFDEDAASAKTRFDEAAKSFGEVAKARSEQINARGEEVAARFRRDDEKLAELELKLPGLLKRQQELDAELQSVRSETKKVPELAKKVERLEDEVSGKPLPAETERRLRGELDSFRHYLQTIGFPSTPDIALREGTGQFSADNIYYTITAKTPMIVIGTRYANDPGFVASPDAVYHEYMFRALRLANAKADDDNEAFNAGPGGDFRYALADYYAASFSGEPALYKSAAAVLKRVGGYKKDEIRDLRAERRFKGRRTDTVQEDSQAWSTAFWALRRTELGKEKTDKLLLDTWRGVDVADVQGDVRKVTDKLARKLRKKASELYGDRAAETVSAVLEKRGIRLSEGSRGKEEPKEEAK